MASLLEWVSATSGVAGVTILVLTIRHARRQAIATLRAHIEIAAQWARGPSGEGWDADDVRPIHRLLWMSPQWSVFGQHSAPAITQTGLLGNLALDPELAPFLAAVAQSLESLNAAVGRCEAFKAADATMYATVWTKLQHGLAEVVGEGQQPPDELTEEQELLIVDAAGLSAAELQWCRILASLWRSVHVRDIGPLHGTGLHRHLAALRIEFERRYGLWP